MSLEFVYLFICPPSRGLCWCVTKNACVFVFMSLGFLYLCIRPPSRRLCWCVPKHSCVFVYMSLGFLCLCIRPPSRRWCWSMTIWSVDYSTPSYTHNIQLLSSTHTPNTILKVHTIHTTHSFRPHTFLLTLVLPNITFSLHSPLRPPGQLDTWV